MANIGNHSLEDIKLFMLCVLSGRAEREHVLTYLCAIADYSDISYDEDWKSTSELTAAMMFVQQSIVYLDDERFDEWIEYYTQHLIRIENYTLMHELHL